MEELRKIIGKNLSELRKNKGLTQLELAEMFNYTDRAVSKWENGDTLPDIEILYNLCEFYGVTLDYLTHEENYSFVKKNRETPFKSKIWITALISSLMWLLATVTFVISLLSKTQPLWQAFVWAVPASAFMVIILNRIYFRNRLVYFLFWSLFVWSILVSVHLSFLPSYNVWPIYLLGVPAQATLFIWLNIKVVKKEK